MQCMLTTMLLKSRAPRVVLGDEGIGRIWHLLGRLHNDYEMLSM